MKAANSNHQQDNNIRQISDRVALITALLAVPLMILVTLYIQVLNKDLDALAYEKQLAKTSETLSHLEEQILYHYVHAKGASLEDYAVTLDQSSVMHQVSELEAVFSVSLEQYNVIWKEINQLQLTFLNQPSVVTAAAYSIDPIVNGRERSDRWQRYINKRLELHNMILQSLMNLVSDRQRLSGDALYIVKQMPHVIGKTALIEEQTALLLSLSQLSAVSTQTELIHAELKNLKMMIQQIDKMAHNKKIISDHLSWMEAIKNAIEKHKMQKFVGVLGSGSGMDDAETQETKVSKNDHLIPIPLYQQLYSIQQLELDKIISVIEGELGQMRHWRTAVLVSVLFMVILAAFLGYYIVKNIRYTHDYMKDQNSLLESKIKERVREIEKAHAMTEALNKKLIEEKERAQILTLKAQDANRAKSLFLATMSHEIRTPLNSVIGGSDILKKTSLNERQSQMVSLIHKSGTLLLELVNDVLDFSKIEAGELVIEQIEFDLEKLFLEVMNLFLLRVRESNLYIHLFFDYACEGHWQGDPTRIKQIVMNLISNAAKFTHEGGIICKVNLNEDVINIKIEDSGIGISLENQEKLFNAFVQTDNSINRKYGGTGLGLSITKHLIEAMAGSIQLESEEGIGTRFTITLPLTKVESDKSGLLEHQDEPRGVWLLVASHTLFKEKLHNWHYPVEFIDQGEPLEQLVSKIVTRQPDWLLIEGMTPKKINAMVALLKDKASEWAQRSAIIFLQDHTREPIANLEGITLHRLDHDRPASWVRAKLNEIVHDDKGLDHNEATSMVVDDLERHYKGRVLLVEDVPFNQIIAMDILGDLGLEVECANNGVEAVEAFKRGEYDLILMDLHMPEMNGFEAVEQIRQLESVSQREKPTPIVAMTADVLAETRERVKVVGMNEYLSKPFDPTDLYKILDQFI